jgi:hypothetical protein
MKALALALAGLGACATPAVTRSTCGPKVYEATKAPSWKYERVGEIKVDGSELSAPGMGPPSREELLDALARKAKALGADAVTAVVVDEGPPVRDTNQFGNLTSVGGVSLGQARGVAVRRVSPPGATASSDDL